MKKLILAALISTSTFATVNVPTVQSNSDWAKGMTAMACKTDFPSSYTGEIRMNDEGVKYIVMDEAGNEVAAAKAKSTWLLAKKVCL